MVAKTSASPFVDERADRLQPRQPSPFHIKITCDLCAVAILLAAVALLLLLL